MRSATASATDVVPVSNVSRPSASARPPPCGGRLADEHRVEALHAGHERGEEPDRPGAEDDGALARLGCGACDRVHSDAERLDQDSLVAGNAVGDDDQVGLGNDDVVGEAPGQLAADEPHLGAQLGPTGPAVEAGAAAHGREDDDGRAGREAVRPAAELFDPPVDLVPDQERRPEERVRARPHLQVGAADTAVLDADAHLALAGHGDRPVADGEVPRRLEHRVPTVGHLPSKNSTTPLARGD